MREKSVGIQLRRLNNQIRRYMDCSASKKKVDSVTGTNGWIICYLANHRDTEIFQKDLEKRFGITRSTASKVLSLMERKGLIARQSVPYDARLKKIALTQKAIDINEMARRDAIQLEVRLTNGFTKAELNALADYLERMQNNLKNFTK
jgi:DNA-binding MarR family transcriptional regulator